MHEYDGPEGELVVPEDFLAHNPVPLDARRMGLDRNTEEGALLALASSLNPAKMSHRLVAWIMLFAVTVPLLLTLRYELF
jgi:hypothetical protein